MVANSGSFVRRQIRLDVFHKTKLILMGYNVQVELHAT